MKLAPFLSLLFAGISTCSTIPPLRELERRDGGLAPLHGLELEGCIQDEYVVMFQRNHTHERHFEAVGKDFSQSQHYTAYDFGYTMNLKDERLRDEVRSDPGVLFVETNRHTYLVEPTNSTDHDEEYTDEENGITKRYTQKTQPDSGYGLQMVAAGGKLKTPVPARGDYDYVDRAGQGVWVYVMDSGIRISHRAFQGRARNFGGLKPTDKSPYCRDTMDDKYGHGTHVAGIIGARSFGVAPNANLINVKVTNNNGRGGTTAALAQAILDIIKEHNANKEEDPDYNPPWKFRGSVINLSLGWDGDAGGVLYQLIDAEEAGIKVYAAAGNSNKDASNIYPCANVQTACITAVDNSYNKAWFSNYGSAINYIAPGDEILSMGVASDTALAKKSGTSMATGFASGTAAIFTFWQGLVNDQTGHYGDYIWWNSLSGLATGFKGTNNLFINTGIHSKKKYNNEPFRWAGDWPVKNHEVTNNSVTAAIASDQQLTTFATEMATSTVSLLGGFTTEPDSPSSVFEISIDVPQNTSAPTPFPTANTTTSSLDVPGATDEFAPVTPTSIGLPGATDEFAPVTETQASSTLSTAAVRREE